MKYLTKSAYVQIAIKGTNYCQSAVAAFKLTLENPLRIAINSGLSSIIMFIGKATITCLVTVASYYAIMRIQYYALLITSPIAPTIICGIIAYAISAIYMMVYGVSCNAIIQCFITDESEQLQKGRKARYCPEPLR
jgi:solute carrier family 44 protein 1 (choline transporter-like protein)